MRIQISDVVVRTRWVELPERCPKCKVKLTSDSFMLGYLAYGFTQSSKATDDTIWGPDQEFCQNDSDRCVLVTCRHCTHELVMGREKALDPVPDGKQTQWTAGLDRLVFRPEV